MADTVVGTADDTNMFDQDAPSEAAGSDSGGFAGYSVICVAPSCEEQSPEAAAEKCTVTELSPTALEPLDPHSDGLGDEEAVCRICLDGEQTADNPLITPCLCAGSMRYVHRACLDEWRIQSFNPKALVSCTTCKVQFRTRYEGDDAEYQDISNGRWWVRFAKDVAWYVSLRIIAFLLTSVAFGFWPYLFVGVGLAVHPNPIVNHMLIGSGSSFALLGTIMIVQLPGLWHTGEGLRVLFELRRCGGSKGSGLEVVILMLILIGLIVCLYYLLKGVWHIFNEGRQEVARAVRGANVQVRSKVVKSFVVLDYPGSREDESVDIHKEESTACLLTEPPGPRSNEQGHGGYDSGRRGP